MPTARDWRDAVLAILAWAVILGLCDPAPAQDVRAPQRVAEHDHRERTMDRYLTEAEQERLLAVLKAAGAGDVLARRDDAVVRALTHSGCRIGEFSQVTVGAALAALRSGYLFLPRETRKGGRRDHKVFVTAPLREAIGDLLKVRYEMRRLDCREGDPLVIGRTGAGLSVRSFELRLKQWAVAADIAPDFTPHWLRHTRAMNVMRRSTAKDPRGIVQAALGHESIRSTGVYTTPSREEVEAALTETDGRGRGRVTVRDLRRAFERRVGA